MNRQDGETGEINRQVAKSAKEDGERKTENRQDGETEEINRQVAKSAKEDGE